MVKNMIGMDYGVKPNVMLIGDIEFSNLLRKADFVGLGYIVPKHLLVNEELRMAFIFAKPDAGKIVFERFLNWIDGSNGDTGALSLEFIDHKDKTYTLAISQSIDQLISRCIPSYQIDWVNPIFSSVTHFKKIDITSGSYFAFKDAAKYRKVHIGAATPGPNYAYPIHEREIIKNDIKFYDEDDIPDSSTAQAINKDRIKKCKPPNPTSSDIETQRLKALRYFYPITYDKINSQLLFKSVIDVLIKDFSHSQIVQAICNLEIYFKLERLNKLDMLNSRSATMNLLDFLLLNQEAFSDLLSEDKITRDMVLKQIRMDQNVQKGEGE